MAGSTHFLKPARHRHALRNMHALQHYTHRFNTMSNGVQKSTQTLCNVFKSRLVLSYKHILARPFCEANNNPCTNICARNCVANNMKSTHEIYSTYLRGKENAHAPTGQPVIPRFPIVHWTAFHYYGGEATPHDRLATLRTNVWRRSNKVTNCDRNQTRECKSQLRSLQISQHINT